MNGVDTSEAPNTSFTWNWGDGAVTHGFFPQFHTYGNLRQSYSLLVVSHKNGGTSACAELTIQFTASSPRLITTVVGTDWFFSAEGKPGIHSDVSNLSAQGKCGPRGSVYVPDPLNFLVFKIGTDGVTHVVAGIGIQGFSRRGRYGRGREVRQCCTRYPAPSILDGPAGSKRRGGRATVATEANPSGAMASKRAAAGADYSCRPLADRVGTSGCVVMHSERRPALPRSGLGGRPTPGDSANMNACNSSAWTWVFPQRRPRPESQPSQGRPLALDEPRRPRLSKQTARRRLRSKRNSH